MAVELKRRLARAVAVITIALAAGHLVQNMPSKAPKRQAAEADLAAKPVHIETLAATANTTTPAAVAQPAAAKVPETAVATVTPPVAPVAEATAAPVILADASPTPPVTTVAPAAPINADVAQAQPTLPQTAPVPAIPDAPVAVAAADPCPVTLDLYNDVNVMIGVTLVSPCHKSERVVLKHAGLAVTARTNTTGVLFTDVPALEENATIEVLFKDGTSATANLQVPDIGKVRRFAVQWQSDDAFQIHAFEDAAGYGGPGDVARATSHRPAAGLPTTGGFLTVLGDDTTDLPLMAELYTYPADTRANPEIVVEAAVTPKACGREMLGETLTSMAGKVAVADLNVTMPDCDAVGDYLVLKNLVADVNIASSN